MPDWLRTTVWIVGVLALLLTLVVGYLMWRYRIPPRGLVAMGGAALYLISPIDLVPEAILGPLGLVDDAGVVAAVVLFVYKLVKARRILADGGIELGRPGAALAAGDRPALTAACWVPDRSEAGLGVATQLTVGLRPCDPISTPVPGPRPLYLGSDVGKKAIGHFATSGKQVGCEEHQVLVPGADDAVEVVHGVVRCPGKEEPAEELAELRGDCVDDGLCLGAGRGDRQAEKPGAEYRARDHGLCLS